VSLFSTPPALWRSYARAAFALKPRLVPPGRSVPRLEARWPVPRLDAAHLDAYRTLCGFDDDGLPLTYPHVLASGAHLGVLVSPGFPVRLLGLVHLSNVIEAPEPLPRELGGDFSCWLEGHRDSERGHLFELHTTWHLDGRVRWRETSTFLARVGGGAAKPRPAPEPRPAPSATHTFDAPAGLGRRYGVLAGDLNPIHVSDVTARLFGFPRAIAHGMWSLARCAALLDVRGPCRLEAHFKLPVLLPATVCLERRDGPAGVDFTLLDARGEKPHLAGRVTSG
jgi:hypothetical protein